MFSGDSLPLFLFNEPEGGLLRIAGIPSSAREADGSIEVQVPFFAHNAAKVEDRVLTLRLCDCGGHSTRLLLDEQESLPGGSEMLVGNPVAESPLSLRESEDAWEVHDASGRLRAIIQRKEPPIKRWSDQVTPARGEMRMQLFTDGETAVDLDAHDHFFPRQRDGYGLAFTERDGRIESVCLGLGIEHDECFTGTGERFAEMDLKGRTFQLVNRDGLGVNSRRTYKNVPFYLSSRPYGAFFHSSAEVRMSLGDISTRGALVNVRDNKLDVFLIGGSTPEKILYNYRQLTGFPPELPLWSYGTWMARMTYFTAEEVEGIGQRLREEDYPCDVLHIDTGWFAKDWVCEWKFGPQFPDPAAFMARLREQGFRVTLWQNVNIMKECCWAEELEQRRLVAPMKGQEGPASDFSDRDMSGQLDFSNPEAVKWYQEKLGALLDEGAAAIKTDFGEQIEMDADYHSYPAYLLRNLYALLYQKAAFEITEKKKGQGIVWARAGWAGCQRYPLHWGGDAAATWEGMAGSLRGGLHLGLSGFAYWSHDVPGFHGLPNFMNSRPADDLMVRWTQFGVFSSHLRYHGTSPREPWEFPAVSHILREWLRLRYALIPYIVEQAKSSIRTGMPLLRALCLHHPKDRLAWAIDDEYYFGEDFLVAPVMSSTNRRTIYLPDGKWVDFWSGEIVEGPVQLIDREYPLERLPLFVRHGSVIPVYPEPVQSTDDMDMNKVVKLEIGDSFSGVGESCLAYCGRF